MNIDMFQHCCQIFEFGGFPECGDNRYNTLRWIAQNMLGRKTTQEDAQTFLNKALNFVLNGDSPCLITLRRDSQEFLCREVERAGFFILLEFENKEGEPLCLYSNFNTGAFNPGKNNMEKIAWSFGDGEVEELLKSYKGV